MRILHVVPTYLPAVRYGGPVQSVHGLCRALAARGHDVSVFTTNIDGPGVSDVPVGQAVNRDGVRVWYFPAGLGRGLYRSPGMERALAASLAAADILHLHSVFRWPTPMAARRARKAGVPYVLAPRGMLVADLIRARNPLLKWAWINLFERASLAGAAAVHATSAIEAAEIRRLGLAFPRIAIVPNGTDAPGEAALAEAAAAPLPFQGGVQERRPFVLSLGRITWKKRLDRLIAAMAHLPDADLVIAGNDSEGCRPGLERFAQRLGLMERVRFAGFVQGAEKWALYRQAAVFALPSRSENFGNSVLEAMAAGCPVLVTPEVGLADTVRETGAGIVACGTAQAFGEAIAALLSYPGRRAQMGQAGRRAAREKFSWAAAAKDMEEVYRSCLADRRASASLRADPPPFREATPGAAAEADSPAAFRSGRMPLPAGGPQSPPRSP